MTSLSATQRTLLPDDILSAVLALAARKSSRQLEFRAHDFKLQKIFYELSGKFDCLRSQFVFSDSGPERFSPTLNESFARLQLAGLIGRKNPDYEWVFLRPEADTYYAEELEPRLDPDVKQQLADVADAFLASLGLS